ncbi:MAG TPA: Gfo/Idh/MocA family oxidoreductase [Rubricoccaceae bacterium]|jgi:predicted dehydrogenase
MNPLRIGLIGYGGFGRFLHQTWEADGSARIVAISSLSGGPGTVPEHARWQDLLLRDDVDLVAVASPPGTHAEIGAAALDAGKHLLVEKPVATTLAGADQLIAARGRSGRVAAVDFMLRFNPVVEALVAWGSSGAFGPLVRVTVENEAQDASLPPDHWFWDRAQSGGILAEHAVHFFDIVNAIVEAQGGAPARASAEGWASRRADGREDRVLAVVQHAEHAGLPGVLATHAHAFTRPGAFERTTMRFTFALAEVDVEGWVPLSGVVRALVGPDAEADLARLPGLAVTSDDPWPEGRATVGGVMYPAGRHVTATFAVATPKPEAYASALRALLADVQASIAQPGRPVRAGLDAGRDALRQALAARASADARALSGGGARSEESRVL